MITERGYSKEPPEAAEGIAVTFGKEMINEQGGLKHFLEGFLECMANEEDWWMHKMKNKPTVEVADVYIIVCNRLYGKVNFGWYENEETIGHTMDGREVIIDWPRLCLVGPFIRCPFKRELKGFQGFRYTKKLF